jgi:hypothetical protein
MHARAISHDPSVLSLLFARKTREETLKRNLRNNGRGNEPLKSVNIFKDLLYAAVIHYMGLKLFEYQAR